MANDTRITFIGNLTADPELTFTNGVARARFRVASNPSHFDRNKNTWVEDTTIFMPVTAWRDLAEHATESLRKGDRVIVSGTVRQNEWEKDGEKFPAWR